MSVAPGVPLAEDPPGTPPVRGFLHLPPEPLPARDGLVLTHGAGSSAGAPLLIALAEAFAARGLTVLRCDLPYRQASPSGPPPPSGAARDRDGLRAALTVIRRHAPGRAFLGGHSYGGRQASLLAADEPGESEALLLLSYPLHPPRRPAELRTGHFPRLRTPALFVHGTRDPFGSLAELRAALALVPARTMLLAINGAGHDLGGGRGATRRGQVGDETVAAFLALVP